MVEDQYTRAVEAELTRSATFDLRHTLLPAYYNSSESQ